MIVEKKIISSSKTIRIQKWCNVWVSVKYTVSFVFFFMPLDFVGLVNKYKRNFVLRNPSGLCGQTGLPGEAGQIRGAVLVTLCEMFFSEEIYLYLCICQLQSKDTCK